MRAWGLYAKCVICVMCVIDRVPLAINKRRKSSFRSNTRNARTREAIAAQYAIALK